METRGNTFLLLRVTQGTHLGLRLGFTKQTPPMGLVTKAQPNPSVFVGGLGFWAGFGEA